ncbi:MAG: YdjY domain-containing protein [Pirellulaceae bacterium]
MRSPTTPLGVWSLVVLFGMCGHGAQETEDSPAETARDPAEEAPGLAPPRGLVRLAKGYDIWIDPDRHLVAVDGEVALRAGFLEMFACPAGTKEHESIVALKCKSQYVHAGLLAVGAVVGHPVRFRPDYEPATGTTIDVWVLWQDKDGKRHKVRAQEWVRNAETKKALEYPWVFAGSGFWTDERTGERFYHAEAGDLICVSNFPSATLDLPVKSSDTNSQLAFEAFTERIPPCGTKIRLALIPRLEKKREKQKEKERKEKESLPAK